MRVYPVHWHKENRQSDSVKLYLEHTAGQNAVCVKTDAASESCNVIITLQMNHTVHVKEH